MFRASSLRLAGRDAALLHVLALHECAAVDGDGVLTPLMVLDAANLYGLKPKPLTDRLVERGVWHDAGTLAGCYECNERSRLGVGEFLICRWWEPLLHKQGKEDPVFRDRELRRKRLNRDRNLVTQIRSRDRDLCRYCGCETTDSSGANKKGRRARQLDHVDPWSTDGPKHDGNTLANVVVACRTCNGRKKDRKPEEAGMRLLPPGTRARSGPDDPAHRPDTEPDHPAQNPAVSARARETGQGRVGAGLVPETAGSVPGRNGNGTGQ